MYILNYIIKVRKYNKIHGMIDGLDTVPKRSSPPDSIDQVLEPEENRGSIPDTESDKDQHALAPVVDGIGRVANKG
jgi:hypothetical protein